MKELLETVIHESDDGIGLDPILKRFVWDKLGVDPEKLKRRERAITAYYKGVLQQSKNVRVAHDKTVKWASGIFR